ncbi:uncharacterized protein TNCV_105241 [Trichonephila clavipes]|nr:uncharacterized protein TNCV_105241 [Trichonephila clavipes]
MTPERAPPLLTTTPHQREDVSALDRFNVHRCPTRRVFSGTGLELVTKQATVRYLYHSATAATKCSDQVVSLTRNHPYLVPMHSMPRPGFEPRTCGGEARYATTQPLAFKSRALRLYTLFMKRALLIFKEL